MINLITGTPGAGKTYLAIKLLIDQYFFYHKKDRSFYRNEKSKKYTIFTNIDDLKLPHKNLTQIFEENNIDFETFFTVPYQEKLHKKYPFVIYVIDEAQRYIPYNFKNKDVVYYFDYHRHFGDKIYLITQDYSKISKSINVLSELEYRAVKSTFSLFGEFRYNIKSAGDIFKRKTMKKDKKIFDLYTSFVGDDQMKHTNPLKYYVFFLIALFAFMVPFFYWYITPSKAQIEKARHPKKVVKTQFKPSLNPVSSVSPLISEPSLKPDKIRAVRIRSYVLRKNKLYAFISPVTNHLTYVSQLRYPVKKIGRFFYALLSVRDYSKLKLQNKIFFSSSSHS